LPATASPPRSRTRALVDLDAAEVDAFLRWCGLDGFAEPLRAHRVDGHLLEGLDAEDLKELRPDGSKFQRKRLFRAVDRARRDGVPREAVAVGPPPLRGAVAPVDVAPAAANLASEPAASERPVERREPTSPRAGGATPPHGPEATADDTVADGAAAPRPEAPRPEAPLPEAPLPEGFRRLSTLTVAEVGTFLRAQRLGAFAPALRDELVDGALLQELEEADVADLGDFGGLQRKRLVRAVRTARSDGFDMRAAAAREHAAAAAVQARARGSAARRVAAAVRGERQQARALRERLAARMQARVRGRQARTKTRARARSERKRSLSSLSAAEVDLFLRASRLAVFARALLGEEVDGALLSELDDHDLSELGDFTRLQRKRLGKAIVRAHAEGVDMVAARAAVGAERAERRRKDLEREESRRRMRSASLKLSPRAELEQEMLRQRRQEAGSASPVPPLRIKPAGLVRGSRARGRAFEARGGLVLGRGGAAGGGSGRGTDAAYDSYDEG
jgi:hypothetical protein